MVFVFDLDDTLCDTDAFSESYIKEFIEKHNLPYNYVNKNVRFAEMKFDWDEAAALEWYKTYGDEMMLHFPVKEGAVEFVNGLYDAGHTVVIATARANDWHTDPKGITFQWLKNVGLKFSKIYIGSRDKERICRMEKADFFVDDDLKIVGKVAETMNGACKVCLSTTEYNKDLPVPKGAVRINNIGEILDNNKISERYGKEL